MKVPVVRMKRVEITDDLQLARVRDEIHRLQMKEKELQAKLDEKLERKFKK